MTRTAKPTTQYPNDHQQAACGLLDKSGHALPAQQLHNDYSATFFLSALKTTTGEVYVSQR
jgi:hypothetical protein